LEYPIKAIYHHRTRGAGAEGVHILGMVHAFRKLGIEVLLISFPGSDPEAANSESLDKTSRTDKSSPSLLRWLAGLTRHTPEFIFELFELAYNLVGLVRLRRGIRAFSPDFIYERYSLFMVLGVWLARRKSIPIILEVNDSALVERVRPLTYRWLARKMEAYAFRNASGLVFISTAFKSRVSSQVTAIAPSKICPNAADIDQFCPDPEARQRIRSRYKLTDKVVCGYVGAFVYWHGIEWFMEEIAPSLKQYPRLSLLLVGDGVVFAAIQQLVRDHQIEDQVIMTGRVPHEQVGELVSAMDFGILPDSNDYGSPMKLFEKMAMGVAVVAPAFGPISEVVKDAETGWLFPPKDKKAAVDLVLGLAGNIDEVRQVGDNARRYIIDERQWIHNAQASLTLLRESEN